MTQRGRKVRRHAETVPALAGVVVAITGGSRGIGLATAQALAAAGATVAIGDLDVPPGWLADQHPAVRAWRVDVTDQDAFAGFLDEVESTCGPLDVLINNAGIMPLGSLGDEPASVAARQLAINLHAVIHGSRDALRRMLPRGRGHIVNVASQAGKVGFPGAATYCATKHGVVGLSEALRAELRGSGVAVSCVMPTVVRTELATGLGESPLVRPVTPQQVADAITAVVRRPRFDVYVPRSLAVVNRLLALAPRALRDALLRISGADRVLARADPVARAGYDARAVPERGQDAMADRPRERERR
ncbi:SDR family oxidoreductase [Amycolatopsis acididurans]|uniref:SDR family oxidoreductase n=1 Tax=Amycolatopsis acididurans TaxID=2724524 RepID=UPI0028A6E225|nr:SDR family oxidoreductase [Amycolatopsis acididurans]